jgi:hypothetical protein
MTIGQSLMLFVNQSLFIGIFLFSVFPGGIPSLNCMLYNIVFISEYKNDSKYERWDD